MFDSDDSWDDALVEPNLQLLTGTTLERLAVRARFERPRPDGLPASHPTSLSIEATTTDGTVPRTARAASPRLVRLTRGDLHSCRQLLEEAVFIVGLATAPLESLPGQTDPKVTIELATAEAVARWTLWMVMLRPGGALLFFPRWSSEVIDLAGYADEIALGLGFPAVSQSSRLQEALDLETLERLGAVRLPEGTSAEEVLKSVVREALVAILGVETAARRQILRDWAAGHVSGGAASG